MAEVKNFKRECERFIIQRKHTIKELMNLRDAVQKTEFNCKIANTVGNVAQIGGTVLCFTPFFFMGVTLLASGAATSIGTSATQYVLDSQSEIRLKEAVNLDSEAQAKLTASATVVMKSSVQTINAVVTAKEAYDVGKLASIIRVAEPLAQGEKVLAAGSLGGKTIITSSTKALSKSVAILGVLVNVGDIIYTWSTGNATASHISEFISLMEMEIRNFEAMLKEM